ncbi:uncharacterized protein [Vulpes vulpes]|uniref:Uncharacterized protein n=1 Tax=Vulpes vulpes TaxID=9627 RepID=A0ABM5AE36_VULVU
MVMTPSLTFSLPRPDQRPWAPGVLEAAGRRATTGGAAGGGRRAAGGGRRAPARGEPRSASRAHTPRGPLAGLPHPRTLAPAGGGGRAQAAAAPPAADPPAPSHRGPAAGVCIVAALPGAGWVSPPRPPLARGGPRGKEARWKKASK